MTQYLVVGFIFTLLLSARAYSVGEWEEYFGLRPHQWILSHLSMVLFINIVILVEIGKEVWTLISSGNKP